ncbi:hypothetical protein Tco_1278471 [Tanacetum coccineum]
MNKVANNQTFEELLKAIKEVTLMVRNLSATVDGSLQVMKEPVIEAPCYDDLGRLYSTKSGVAREKKKVVEETTFHESNKLDLGLGSGAYGEDANYHEFMDDSVMEEIYIASPVMLVAEDLGQKRIHDSSETAMVRGSQGKSNGIGYFNGPIVQNISHNREKSEKIVTDEHIRDYPKPFIEEFRLSLQCLLPRRTWDPRITWLKILKEHLEDKNTIHPKHYSPLEIVLLEKEWKGRALKKG